MTRAVVVIGGGTGSFHVLSGLRGLPGLEIRSIVTMMDAGGDSGRLRDEFLNWQCKIRQMAVREDGGRPSPGMRPTVDTAEGHRLSDGITVLIHHIDPHESTTLFRHQGKRTQDPAERYSKAIEILSASHFQYPGEFSDTLTALFGPGSPIAVMFATDTMEIRLPLTDADLASMQLPVGFTASSRSPGPAAHVSSVTGGRLHTWEGRLVRTEASVDSRTRLVYGVVTGYGPTGEWVEKPGQDLLAQRVAAAPYRCFRHLAHGHAKGAGLIRHQNQPGAGVGDDKKSGRIVFARI